MNSSTPLVSQDPVIETHHLIKAYPLPNGGEIVIVDGFNLKMNEGEYISIIGHSGCGKTTVLMMIAGLLEKSRGSVIVDGSEVEGPGPERAVVFQSPCLLPWMTAYGNVMLGVKRVFPHAAEVDRVQLVEYYLNLVGLGDSMHKYPKELSGGMQQRVGIARAMALKPKMILLDEPFGRLDSLTRMELQDTLMELLAEEKMTAMMVTHDVDEAIYLSDRIVMMTNGPEAKVGNILEVDIARERVRHDVINHPNYYGYREQLLTFLEEQEHLKEKKSPDKVTSLPAKRKGMGRLFHLGKETVSASLKKSS
jgi:nitrate/nitrite transport system ATP-binding protein